MREFRKKTPTKYFQVYHIQISEYIGNTIETTGCDLPKTHLKEMCDFLIPEMFPMALALIETHNLFDPVVKHTRLTYGFRKMSVFLDFDTHKTTDIKKLH